MYVEVEVLCHGMQMGKLNKSFPPSRYKEGFHVALMDEIFMERLEETTPLIIVINQLEIITKIAPITLFVIYSRMSAFATFNFINLMSVCSLEGMDAFFVSYVFKKFSNFFQSVVTIAV